MKWAAVVLGLVGVSVLAGHPPRVRTGPAAAALQILPQAVPGANFANPPAARVSAGAGGAIRGPAGPAAVYWPDDSGYTNVKDCGAKGDGQADDTAAIKAAYARKGGIYFPPGTYLVSDTLLATPKRYFIQGAGPARTFIRLKDNCAGFSDPKNPKAVLQNWEEQIGRGANGQAFRNSYHDLTVDVGAGNPGAIGILYFTDNQGTIENVHVRSSDPQKAGRAGIAMAQNWPGPALLRHVRIDGFDDGIWSIINQYSFTFEHMTLENQRHAGIYNSRQMLFIRGLVSRQKNVPALLADSGTIAIIDSSLTGSGEAAIESGARLYARNVRTEGYQKAIKGGRGGAGDVAGPVVGEFVSGVTTLFDTPKQSLGLPIEESPTADWSNGADWASAATFGAAPDDKADDTEGIQKAIDSGAGVVYLPRGTYDIKGTVHVRGAVQRIHCMESNIESGSGDAFLWRIEDGASPFVVIEQYEGTYASKRPSFEHATARTLVLRTLIPRGGEFYRCTVKGAKLFLDDVCAAPCDFGAATVYARQLNPENMGTKVVVDGGLFWCLGLKAERAGHCVFVRNGGRAEIIGGYIYRNRGTKMPDGTNPEAFVCENASMSVCGIGGDTQTREVRSGDTKTGKFGDGLYVGRAK
jgi:hypothetical protein